MTIDAKHIPPEVVEAAAKAAYEMDAGSPSDTWQQAAKLAKVIYRGQARAAIAAALAAWPGMKTAWEDDDATWFEYEVDKGPGPDALILPLPAQEARDE